MSLTDKIKAETLLAKGGLLSQFMPNDERLAIKQNMRSEEGDHFAQMVINLHQRITDMPHTYQTEAIATPDKIVHLHYFGGSVDAWIVEKDMGDGTDTMQLQAYGKCTLFGEGFEDAEWGYINIRELIDNGIELDMYWTPKPVKECK